MNSTSILLWIQRIAFIILSMVICSLHGYPFLASEGTCDPQAPRIDCFDSQQACLAKGCCWSPVTPNPSNLPWCFQPNVGPTPTPTPPTPPAPTPPPSPSPETCQLSGCATFRDNQCNGDTIITDPSFDARKWFTPPRGHVDWKPSFQVLSSPVCGHVHHA